MAADAEKAALITLAAHFQFLVAVWAPRIRLHRHVFAITAFAVWAYAQLPLLPVYIEQKLPAVGAFFPSHIIVGVFCLAPCYLRNQL